MRVPLQVQRAEIDHRKYLQLSPFPDPVVLHMCQAEAPRGHLRRSSAGISEIEPLEEGAPVSPANYAGESRGQASAERVGAGSPFHHSSSGLRHESSEVSMSSGSILEQLSQALRLG